jgi:RecB family exonuclease
MQPLLPPGFMFSQHSLNTYKQCPRRFYLKYIERQPWPMPEDEEPLIYRAHLERGRIWHQWVARSFLDVPTTPIADASDDPELTRWWRAYQEAAPLDLPTVQRYVELAVTVPLGDYRLYARYDLLALDPGGPAVLVDWKTLEQRPSARTLRARVQTQVYLYTLIAAGAVLTGGPPIQPQHASMLYWFTNYPADPEEIAYSRPAYQRDEAALRALVAEIVARPRDGFPLTDDLRLCAHCTYRTLCHAQTDLPDGALEAWLDEDLDVDLETVEEVEF